MSDSYMRAVVAMGMGMTIGDFDVLPWDEQAKLMAFSIAKRKIEEFYMEVHNSRMQDVMAGEDDQ